MDHMTLDDYRKLVEQVMRETISAGTEATPRSFTNIGKDHARVVVNTMLDYAQSGFCVYSDKLSADVWSADKVRAFLDRIPGAVVRIIVDQSNAMDDDLSALRELRAEVENGRVEVRFSNSTRLAKHMCIADRRHIRLETDAASRKAIVLFGDASLGDAAANVFDGCWELNTVTPITLPT